MLFTGAFWKATLERALKSAAGAVVGSGAFLVAANPFDPAAWLTVAGIALVAFVADILMSVASIKVGPVGSPSLVGEPVYHADADTYGDHARR